VSTYVITGGCGFIGSNFILRLLKTRPDANVINLDKLTYAGNEDNLRDVAGDPRYRFVQGDITDPVLVQQVMESADCVVNFAAETHVDRSLLAGGDFILTDVLGTYVLLEAARQNGRVQRFLHMSTDEVYGDVPEGEYSLETDSMHPRSPYSAAKAGGEMQCRAFVESYDLPVVIARPANNVGPRQHVEKFVPLCTTNALRDEPLPIYGDGKQQRDWLFVEDNCEALDLLLHEGEAGEAYNIGADNHRYNIDVANLILDLTEKPDDLITHVTDRAGHDRRYAVNYDKIRKLGWTPRHDAVEGIQKAVEWYMQNKWWWEKVRNEAFEKYYQQQYGERLATAGGNSE